MSIADRNLDALRSEVDTTSLARLIETEGSDTDWLLPHRSLTVDIETYLQTVMELHFHPEYGTPYWLDRESELGFDPRTDITSVEDLSKFPEADEEVLRSSEFRYVTPQYYDVTNLDISNSSGTTGQKKSMPYGRPVTEDMAEWYAWHVDQRSSTDGDWFAIGPYGLYERHLVSAANACGQACHFVGIEPKRLKKQARVLQEMTSGVGGFMRSLPDLKSGLKGIPRFEATLQAAGDIVASQSFTHFASGVGIPQRLHPKLETRGPTDPKDVETLLLSGGHIPAEEREELASLYPNASIVPMYATSFTGACIDHPDTDHVAYYPMAPSAFLDVVSDGEPVSVGERGRTVIHRVGADFLWPMQVERETARREPARAPFEWNGIAEIQPL
ncbi:MAG: hypothetical protein ABEH65_05630 [Halobacteriales archaeon]